MCRMISRNRARVHADGWQEHAWACTDEEQPGMVGDPSTLTDADAARAGQQHLGLVQRAAATCQPSTVHCPQGQRELRCNAAVSTSQETGRTLHSNCMEDAAVAVKTSKAMQAQPVPVPTVFCSASASCEGSRHAAAWPARLENLVLLCQQQCCKAEPQNAAGQQEPHLHQVAPQNFLAGIVAAHQACPGGAGLQVSLLQRDGAGPVAVRHTHGRLPCGSAAGKGCAQHCQVGVRPQRRPCIDRLLRCCQEVWRRRHLQEHTCSCSSHMHDRT